MTSAKIKMPTQVSKETVRKISGLARLSLSDAEIERLSLELTSIIGYFEKLNELDTKSVEPTSHTLDVVNALRKDIVRESLPVSEALAAAPKIEENLVAVPPIKEEETSV